MDNKTEGNKELKGIGFSLVKGHLKENYSGSKKEGGKRGVRSQDE